MTSINISNSIKKIKPLISISIPILNEAENIDALYSRLKSVGILMQDRCDLEFVFSDNRSTDSSWKKITEISIKDERVKAIRFSKNIGFQRSIFVNYLHTKGDAVMQIDADLQDPPEMLEVFFDEWQKGYDVVYGIRKGRSESILISTIRKIGYWIVDKLSEHHIPRNAGDFRLIDRKILEALFKMKFHNPYLRGVIASLGFNQKGIEYNRDVRCKGKSKFNLFHLFRLGMTAIFHHSSLPLRFASIFGLVILFFSILGSVYYLSFRILNPGTPQGNGLHILVLFGIGLQSLFMGIIGEYLLKIYLIIRSDPLAIIDEHLNFKDNDIHL